MMQPKNRKSLSRLRIRSFSSLLMLSACSTLLAQPLPATIVGTVADCGQGELIRAVRPVVGGYLNYFYTAEAPQADVQNGHFKVTFAPQPQGELVSLQAKCLPQLYAFVEAGATITLRQTAPATAAGPGAISFEGTNAAGNNLLLNGQLFNQRAGVDEKRVLAILTAAPTAKAALTSLRRELRRSTTRLDSVRSRGLISQACHSTLRAEAEQYMLFWTGGILVNYFTGEKRPELGIKLSDKEMERLAKALYTEFDPFDPRYQGLGVSISNAHNKCILLEKGRLPFLARPPQRQWNQYAEQFKDVNSAFGAYDFAPPKVQDRLVGNELLTALVFRAMSSEQYAAVLQAFVQRFPASPYVSVLTQALVREQAAGSATPTSSASVPNPNQDLGRYEEVAGALTFAPIIGLDSLTTLTALVRQQFPGRAVFVDFWASWCGPCIAEFRYEPQLHELLTKHNIEPLYVALNNANYRPKWREFVAQHKLRGTHYLANAVVQKALGEQFSGIPRYMLFDQDGQLVDDNMPHPGAVEELRQRIMQKLHLK